MNSAILAPITLGHNAFFGVDHLSSARGSERSRQFSDPAHVLGMVRRSHELGARGMMLSTHERAAPILDLMRRDPALKKDMRIYPLLPYINKYVTKANEVGLVNLVLDSLAGTDLKTMASMIWQGGRGILGKDVFAILSALIQLELKPFKGIATPAVFLHDALTDLALGLGVRDVFEFYIRHIEEKHDSRGAFATKNLPALLRRFQEWGLPAPVVMTHFNKAGYHMNPSREACEVAARGYPVSIMAMGSLASGFLKPDEAYEYLASVPNIDSVVVGVSSPEHARETFAAIERHRVVRAMRGPAEAPSGPASL